MHRDVAAGRFISDVSEFDGDFASGYAVSVDLERFGAGRSHFRIVAHDVGIPAVQFLAQSAATKHLALRVDIADFIALLGSVVFGGTGEYPSEFGNGHVQENAISWKNRGHAESKVGTTLPHGEGRIMFRIVAYGDHSVAGVPSGRPDDGVSGGTC